MRPYDIPADQRVVILRGYGANAFCATLSQVQSPCDLRAKTGRQARVLSPPLSRNPNSCDLQKSEGPFNLLTADFRCTPIAIPKRGNRCHTYDVDHKQAVCQSGTRRRHYRNDRVVWSPKPWAYKGLQPMISVSHCRGRSFALVDGHIHSPVVLT